MCPLISDLATADRHSDALTHGTYDIFISDVPQSGRYKGRWDINKHWNLIVKAAEICNAKRIPAIIFGFRCIAWRHDAAKQLLGSRAMVESHHRWCSFGCSPFNDESDPRPTEVSTVVYSNQALTVASTPCSCPPGTDHRRHDCFSLSYAAGYLAQNRYEFYPRLFPRILKDYIDALGI